MTSPPERVGRSLAFDDVRHLDAYRWLVDEVYLLDAQDYEAWLRLLADDIRYVMPVTVTRPGGATTPDRPSMAHLDEDRYSLGRRVARFATGHAWAEDPPSRLRHHLTNVRTFATSDTAHLAVESAVLLFRSRGDVDEPSLLSCGRTDILRRHGDGWLLAHRTITPDEAVLRMQNLAVFL